MLPIPTDVATWLSVFGIAGASGLGVMAYRLGHDYMGPIVSGCLNRS